MSDEVMPIGDDVAARISTARGRGAPREPGTLRRELVAWLRERLDGGAVFGLSGGIDSAVVCGLCADAVGAERCLALMLPIGSDAADERLARAVAIRFGVPATAVRLDPVHDAALAASYAALAAADGVDACAPDIARANLKPRLRMATLYHFANLTGRLVVGTGNAAERLVGYFTKWGDGGTDLLPLGDLLKREVYALGRELGVPLEVLERAPSAGLWEGQTDENELGLRYEQIDRFLLTGSTGDAGADALIIARHEAAWHKLDPVPIARPG